MRSTDRPRSRLCLPIAEERDDHSLLSGVGSAFRRRIFGGRDVALGLALAMASRADPKLERQILLLGVACDGWDAVSALTAGADMPRWGRALVALTGTTWAALGIVAVGAAPRTGGSGRVPQ